MNYYDRSLDALMHAYGRYNVTFDHGDGIHLYDVNVEEGTLTERKSHTGQQLFPHCPFLKRQIPVFDCR